jgi:hypothetical protein
VKKRNFIIFMVLTTAAAVPAIGYLSAWRSDLTLLAQSNPAAACRQVRMVFRLMAAGGFAGMMAAALYLIHLGRCMLRAGAAAEPAKSPPGKAKPLAAVLAGVFFVLVAAAFAWFVLSVDEMLECEKLPTSHVGDVVQLER